MSGPFLDSNVLVYAFTRDVRATKARELLNDRPVLSVQSLNEFSNVMRRKLGKDWKWLGDAIEEIRLLCSSILPLTIETHGEALRIAERYRYSIYDALIVAAALQSRCDTLWSEDMQDGIVIDGRLRIANPFRAE